jgi:hypothetical protein
MGGETVYGRYARRVRSRLIRDETDPPPPHQMQRVVQEDVDAGTNGVDPGFLDAGCFGVVSVGGTGGEPEEESRGSATHRP